jgi:hypothetical protein
VVATFRRLKRHQVNTKQTIYNNYDYDTDSPSALDTPQLMQFMRSDVTPSHNSNSASIQRLLPRLMTIGERKHSLPVISPRQSILPKRDNSFTLHNRTKRRSLSDGYLHLYIVYQRKVNSKC